MATCNGARFLDEQLASIARQTYPDIDLWVSDDGSTDETIAVLSGWAKRWTKGQMRILQGSGEGKAENFRSLIVNTGLRADYFAFADQHDIWEQEKIAASVRWIEQNAFAVPSVFCSRSVTIGQDAAVLGPSRQFVRNPDFRNALVQSIATGNTMLYNRMAHDLLAQSCRTTEFFSHDWWLYLIVSGAGGVVHHDPRPLVHERQVGSGSGWRTWVVLGQQFVADRLAEPANVNMQGLVRNRDLLSEEAQEICDLYWKVRSDNFIKRLYYLHKSGVYRQTAWEQVKLYLAALLRRL
jgi:glycosyltransferase involved in cell wall biosynthesis